MAGWLIVVVALTALFAEFGSGIDEVTLSVMFMTVCCVTQPKIGVLSNIADSPLASVPTVQTPGSFSGAQKAPPPAPCKRPESGTGTDSVSVNTTLEAVLGPLFVTVMWIGV